MSRCRWRSRCSNRARSSPRRSHWWRLGWSSRWAMQWGLSRVTGGCTVGVALEAQGFPRSAAILVTACDAWWGEFGAALGLTTGGGRNGSDCCWCLNGRWCHMGHRLPAISFALVALEVPLCKKHLYLISNCAGIPVGKDLLLGFIDPMPFGANIDAACDASLLTTLVKHRNKVGFQPYLFLAWQCRIGHCCG